MAGVPSDSRSGSALPAAAGGGGTHGRDVVKPADGKRRTPHRRREVEAINVTVPVTFKNKLVAADTAFLVSELLRHVLFARGQLPMPHQQLLQILDERESLDRRLQEERRAAGTTNAAVRTSDPNHGGGDQGATSGGRQGSAKRRRPLARDSAHRRGRKTLAALENVTECIEEAFVGACASGRQVLEAIILIGSSFLSPREIYSMSFSWPRVGPVVHREDGSSVPPIGSSGVSCAGRSRSSLAEAYSRKMVRSLVGGTSGVVLPALGPCRVHVFFRLTRQKQVGANGPLAPQPVPGTTGGSGLGTLPEGPSSDADTMMSSPQAAPRAPGVPDTTPPRTTPPHEPPLLVGPPLKHLVPRPGFKIRVSRTRPAPRVSVVISTAGGAQQDHKHPGSQAGRGGPVEWREAGGISTGDEEGSEEPGTWHQLVSARLVGLKGGDSLVG